MTTLPDGVMRAFAEAAEAELGREALQAVLPLAGLPADLPALAGLRGEAGAQAFADLQRAMRSFYGRGARGLLRRVAARMWPRLIETGGLRARARAGLVRSLPVSLRRKAALELLGALLCAEIRVHTLDLDLLLVDPASPRAGVPGEAGPTCHLTAGLIAEALNWAEVPARSIEETTCRASGAQVCEFKILTGEK